MELTQQYLLSNILIDRELLKTSLLIIIFTFSLSSVSAQFYKRFSIDIGINKSKIFNTGVFFPGHEDNLYQSGRIEIKSETPAITTNYSMSLGFHVYKNHHLSIRHSRNNIGTYISGNFGYNAFCAVGESPLILNHALNQRKNSTLGIKYEFQLPIQDGALTFGAGFEKQWNDLENTFIIFPGSLFTNHSIYTSIGLMTPLFSIVHLYSNVFANKALESDPSEFFPLHFSKEDVNFIPLQVGIEIGVRIDVE